MRIILQWTLILISASAFVLCDYLSANWGKNNSVVSLFIMFSIAPIAYVLFGILNRTKSLSVSSGLVNMLLLIGTILVGIFIFKDQLNIKQIIGLIFAITAIGLLAI